MSFATFHYKHGTFFYAKFHSYVLTVYSNGMNESFQFFIIIIIILLFWKFFIPTLADGFSLEFDW